MTIRRSVIGLTVALTTAWSSAPRLTAQTPQQSPQQPVFRGGTILVPVDVRVLDRNGKPVTDLKTSDFTVLEDGVPQQIAHFSAASLTADPAAAAALKTRQSLRNEPTAQTRRVFLIMFGRGRLQHPSMGVDAMLRFVREDLLPQDTVAVFYHDRATDFTTDHAVIAALIERFKSGHESVEAQLSSWITGPRAVYGSAGIPPKIQAQIDAIFAGAPGVREVPPSAGGNARNIDLDLNDQLNQQTIASFGDFVVDNRQTMQDAGSLYTGIEYLRRVDGEKHLIFLSEQGLNLPRADYDRGLGADANDARVVIDTIMTAGLGDNAPPPTANGRPTLAPTQIDRFFRNASMGTFAAVTGGLDSGHTLSWNAVTHINDATMFSYLLGYYPTNTVLNGKYRNIQIKVDRPDVTVYFRHGYYAADSVTPFNRKLMITTSRMTIAANYEKEIRDIALRASGGFLPGTGTGGSVSLDVTIDPSRLVFVAANGQHTDTLQVAVFCTNTSGDLVGSTQQALNLSLPDASFDETKAKGISYAPKIPVSARASVAKIVVYDYQADLVGSAIVRLR